MNGQQEIIVKLLVVATLLPLLSSALIIVLTRRVLYLAAGWFATAVMAGAFLCSVAALFMWLGLPVDQRHALALNVPWIPMPGTEAGALYLGAMVDSLTIAMMVMVTGIALLVHLYSIGYMEGDKRFNWFFAYLSLFSFSMLGIVISNSVMQLLVCWELVGLTSYLLIGFWFEKRAPQLACKKAWVMNRIGDAGFIVGFGILFYQLGGRVMLPPVEGVLGADGQPITSMFGAIQAAIGAGQVSQDPPLWLTAAGIGLFFGAIGKSAQFPLHTWLPDAMEGPTPVSSIVHSATMVAAGVYLTARIYPILTPAAHLFIATIGLITLVLAACMALVMTDIKRVLAYSTLSQLGYMILGLGAGAYGFALFHLITHAFFKCCLFQCAGSVINAAHHEQDMRQYGGLGRKLPITMACYAVCTLAIAGASIPYTALGISGFYSKDGIIAGTMNYGQAMADAFGWAGHLFWLGPTVVAYVTVFYMARSFALTFLGRPRNKHLHEHAHEAPWTMTVPQMCLAAMAVLSAPLIMSFWQGLVFASEPGVEWIQRGAVLGDPHDPGMHATHAALLHGFAWILVLAAGIVMYLPGMKISAQIVAVPGIRQLYTLAHNKFYFDALYDILAVNLVKGGAAIVRVLDEQVVDGLVNFCGWLGRATCSLVGLFDSRVIDGLADGVAGTAHGGGQLLSGLHAGRVRGYVLVAFAVAAVVLLGVLVSVIVGTG